MATTHSRPTGTATVNPQGPPFRSSCDGCNLAKVKCSKDRPNCRRCAVRNISCVYGVSLRGMKRPPVDYDAHEPHQAQHDTNIDQLLSPVFADSFPDLTKSMSPDIITRPPVWDTDFNTSTSTYNKSTFDPLNISLPGPGIRPALQLSVTDSFLPVQPHPMSFSMTAPLSHDSLSGCLESPLKSVSPGPCFCLYMTASMLAELSAPKEPRGSVFDDFLTQQRASIAVCTAVLECSSSEHKSGMLLLVKLLAIFIHIVGDFDQFLQQSLGRMPYRPSDESDRREEQVIQANLIRAELARLGVLIGEAERMYCISDSSCAEDTFLLAPVFANLQWKIQARFDAVQSWMPWL